MAYPTYAGLGTFQSGTGALTVPWPSGHATGQFGVLVIESANETIATPSGWTQFTNSPQSTGTAAAAGGVRLAAFYRYATSGAMASVSVPDTGNHTTAQIFTFASVAGIDVTAGSVLATAGSTITLPSVTTTRAECMILLLLANDRDSASTTNLSSWTNANLVSVNELIDQTVTSGVGGGLGVAYGQKATAGNVGTTTVTNAASVTAAMLTVAIYAPITVAITEAATATHTQEATGGSIPVARTEAATATASAFTTRPTWADAIFAGGTSNTLSYLTTVDGMTIDTETSYSTIQALAWGRTALIGVATNLNGYYAGGSDTTGTHWNALDKFSYASELMSAVVATLSSWHRNACAAPSASKGYVYSGANNSNTPTLVTDAIDFSNDTTANIGVASPSRRVAGTVWSADKAFAGGGYASGSLSSSLSSFDLATETYGAVSATLQSARWGPFSFQSDSNGYFAGGYTSNCVSEIDGIRFSDEAAINPTASLVQAKANGIGVTGITKGYLAGGIIPTRTSTIDAFAFIPETSSSTVASLSGERDGLAATSAQFGPSLKNAVTEPLNATDSVGGERGKFSAAYIPISTTVYRYDMFNETCSSLDLVISVYANMGVGSSAYEGHYLGGTAVLSYDTSKSDRVFSFLVETLTTYAAALVAASARAAVGSSASMAYMAGGNTEYNSNPSNLMQKLMFATRTGSAASVALTVASLEISGSQSPSAAYFFNMGVLASNGTKWAFANEAKTEYASILTVLRNNCAVASSSTVAYVMGGFTGSIYTTEIEGWTFSTDTASNPAAVLSAGRKSAAGFNSATKGYAAGGGNPSGMNTVDGIVFSSETAFTATNALNSSGTVNQNAAFSTVSGAIGDALETATALDTKTGTVPVTGTTYNESNANPLTASATQDFIMTLGGTETEAVTAVDVLDVLATMNNARTEPATATDAPASTFITNSSRAEAGAADSTQIGGLLVTVDDTEAGSALDGPAATALFPAAVTEAVTVIGTHPAVAIVVVARTEAAVADDTKMATFVSPQDRIEAATAEATHPAAMVSPQDGTATATATDAPAGTYVTAATKTESATATDVHDFSAFGVHIVSHSADGSATDALAVTAISIVAGTAAGSAADSASPVVSYLISLAEPGSATATAAGAHVQPVAVLEGATAGDAPIAGLWITVSASGLAAASDVAIFEAGQGVSIDELATAIAEAVSLVIAPEIVRGIPRAVFVALATEYVMATPDRVISVTRSAPAICVDKASAAAIPVFTSTPSIKTEPK